MKGFLFSLFFVISMVSYAQRGVMETERFLDYLLDSSYQAAHKLLAAGTAEDLTVDKLQQVFERYTKQFGVPQLRNKYISTYYLPHHIVYRFMWFGDQGFRVFFELNEENEFEAVYFLKESVIKGYELPEYADTKRVNMQPVLIPSNNYALSGELCIPENPNGKIVVMVHGSGPNDRDESLYGNKVFLDIAYGLANHGISSLRYDKNSYLFPFYLADSTEFTLWDETGEDVKHIVNYLFSQAGYSPENLFVLGHSLGAMALPRILDSLPKIGGGIMVSGNARPLQMLLYEQMEFIAKNDDDGLSDADKRRLGILKEQIDNLEILRSTNTDDFSEALPLGLSKYYWKDLLMYDQVDQIGMIDSPILLLQGEGDYQVSIKDFKLFKKALKKRKLPYKAVSYPQVNHLLFENAGVASPAEYQRTRNVEAYIIDDIAEWMNTSDKKP